MNDFDYEKLFEDRGLCVGLWEDYAKDCYQAAELIWYNSVNGATPIRIEGTSAKEAYYPPGTITSYSSPRLLMGYCIELLIKGLIIEQNPKKTYSEMVNVIKGHMLIDLFDKADICYDKKIKGKPTEEDLLERLTEKLYWTKYPAPLSPKYLQNHSFIQNRKDFEMFRNLCKKITNESKKMGWF